MFNFEVKLFYEIIKTGHVPRLAFMTVIKLQNLTFIYKILMIARLSLCVFVSMKERRRSEDECIHLLFYAHEGYSLIGSTL
jgi:hypothetical protein